MKIISLHFKNLNSLKGEFKIDFSRPELANAGLFAITGPTGAGKSTILDAITLALFSFAPRLGDINKKTISEKGVIVTKHTKEAFAHIIFEIGADRYKAEWAIATTNRDSWGELKHTLSQQIAGVFTVITDKKSDTYRKVKEIIRLDENQFTKAIVLSQGKFDEFLKADKNNRYELLEIITGTQIYRKIGQKVFDALREINAKVLAIETQMGNIEMLSDEQIAEILQKKNELEIEANQLKAQLAELDKLKQTKINIANLLEEKDKLEIELIQLNEKIEAFQPKLIQLKNHEKALPLQVDYSKWKMLHQDIELNSNSTIEQTKTLAEQKANKEKLIQQLSTDLKVAVNELNFSEQLEQFILKITDLDNEITVFQVKIKEKAELLNKCYKSIPEVSLARIKDFRTVVSELNNYLINAENQLSALTIPADFDGLSYDEMLDSLLEQSKSYTNSIRLNTERGKLLKEEEDLKKTHANLTKDITDSQTALKELSKNSTQLNEEIGLLQNAFTANQNLMKLEDFRAALVEGTECPCCGSTNHPFAKDKPKVNNKIEEKLTEKKGELEQMGKSIRVLEDALLKQETNSNNLIKRLEELKKLSVDNYTELAEQCLKNKISLDLSLEGLNTLLQATENNINNVKAHKVWNDTKVPLSNYIKLLEEYEKLDQGLKQMMKERYDLFGDKVMMDYKSKLMVSWSNVRRDIISTENALKEQEIKKIGLIKDLETLSTSLTNKAKANGFESIDLLESILLNEEEFKSIKDENSKIETKKVEISTQQKTNRERLKEAEEADDEKITLPDLSDEISLKADRRDFVLKEDSKFTSALLNDETNKRNVANLLAQLAATKEEQGYYITLANLIGDSTGDKFNNIIQRITLRHLFKMTNKRLLTLMDRYQIDLGSEKNEDEIWVIDTYMGDERRVIDSVSGGERFVISLAMALSLSDLASNNVKIDSMFIDEGFGSLSPDDLDNAITMLERMQVENEKTIGIISHVESLKERISTQIQVKKLQNGESALYLKDNNNQINLSV
ncbi:AAA family ATPase [Daejeonella sp.]|uniref:AAA family ATPase n=1 Tax=Daejeonella sp. TaxID=2805397 RepID=UPI0025B8E303|nr:AAA family ATPase [Daejeonella sp.]